MSDYGGSEIFNLNYVIIDKSFLRLLTISLTEPSFV